MSLPENNSSIRGRTGIGIVILNAKGRMIGIGNNFAKFQIMRSEVMISSRSSRGPAALGSPPACDTSSEVFRIGRRRNCVFPARSRPRKIQEDEAVAVVGFGSGSY
ncbi:hypothetical protein EVAR_55398_1 [Eumeta japonica]|uniref:Uncharacterized protein n=1 Tax=Eumeta variegata TaxID=151549 RepID=A0A4C1YSC1_EUMVA|nr:hypothetical protein EVAR_55398_1 [Eumeta japonica]